MTADRMVQHAHYVKNAVILNLDKVESKEFALHPALLERIKQLNSQNFRRRFGPEAGSQAAPLSVFPTTLALRVLN